MATASSLSLVFFFFFQAEDGIRDVAVTGVQTCALPISAAEVDPPAGPGQPKKIVRVCGRNDREDGHVRRLDHHRLEPVGRVGKRREEGDRESAPPGNSGDLRRRRIPQKKNTPPRPPPPP